MFFYSDYAIDKETINIVRGLVDTLGGTLLTCFSNTQMTVMLRITEEE